MALEEIWRDVSNYEGLYQISNFGKVRTLTRKIKCCSGKYRIILSQIKKPRKDKDGYMMVDLSKNCSPRTFKIHRLVLEAFKGKSNLQCNHKNGIKNDNRLCNLEYVTAKQNIVHAIKNGLRLPNLGEKNGMSRLKEKDVIFIKKNKNKYKQKKLAEIFGVDPSTISVILNNKTWRFLYGNTG